GYFTVLTNLFVALAFTSAARGGERPALGRPAVLGCATASIAMVGLVYHLVLRELWAPQGAQWLADMLLHYAVPIAVVAHWLACSRALALPWSLALAWCAWPLGYLVYALLRGAVLGSYPYPFIDVTALGYAKTFVNSAGLLLAFVAVALAVIAVTRSRRPAPA
ncbi:MAG: Pr6Pr family membrane protein, partial [Burkholderiaceae bacterium]